MSEAFEALKNAKHRIDFFGNETPKCPHCGNDYDIASNDAWHLYDDRETHSVNCPTCERDFDVNTRASYTFSTDEQDDEDRTPAVTPGQDGTQ